MLGVTVNEKATIAKTGSSEDQQLQEALARSLKEQTQTQVRCLSVSMSVSVSVSMSVSV